VVIKPSAKGFVSLGSIVTFIMDGKETTYQILGAQEANPAQGKISYLSLLGSSLMGKRVGEKFIFNGQTAEVTKIE
jgi:transcription elongation GreA/GreB family factor